MKGLRSAARRHLRARARRGRRRRRRDRAAAASSTSDRVQAPRRRRLTDVGDRVITPGLVDAHTHACWAGSRHAEYAVRMAGGRLPRHRRGGWRHPVHPSGRGCGERRGARRGRSPRACGGWRRWGSRPSRSRAATASSPSTSASSSTPSRAPSHERPRARRGADVPRAACAPPGADRAAFVARVARELVPQVARAKASRDSSTPTSTQNAFTVDEARAVCEGREAARPRRPPARRAVRGHRRGRAGRRAGRRLGRSRRARLAGGHRGPRASRRRGGAPAGGELHAGAVRPPRCARCAPRASRSSSRATRTPAPPRPRACRSPWRSRCARTASRPSKRCSGRRAHAAASLGLADRGVAARAGRAPTWSCGTCRTSTPSSSRGASRRTHHVVVGRRW